MAFDISTVVHMAVLFVVDFNRFSSRLHLVTQFSKCFCVKTVVVWQYFVVFFKPTLHVDFCVHLSIFAIYLSLDICHILASVCEKNMIAPLCLTGNDVIIYVREMMYSFM